MNSAAKPVSVSFAVEGSSYLILPQVLHRLPAHPILNGKARDLPE